MLLYFFNPSEKMIILALNFKPIFSSRIQIFQYLENAVCHWDIQKCLKSVLLKYLQNSSPSKGKKKDIFSF